MKNQICLLIGLLTAVSSYAENAKPVSEEYTTIEPLNTDDTTDVKIVGSESFRCDLKYMTTKTTLEKGNKIIIQEKVCKKSTDVDGSTIFTATIKYMKY
jgi:hypothetical protein